MANRFLPQFLAAVLPPPDHVPDGELLRRFARDHDPAAFELLLRRHARTVWTACRRILSVEADAEDAFQATFLVLSQKAGSVRGGSAAGWLHRVAVTAALKARRRVARHASATSEQLEAIPARDAAFSDSAATVQEELARLPDRYRQPLLLCELEGLTHAEAATALGCPVGTLSCRLSRARDMLRDRLIRRGISAPAILAPLLSLPQRLIPQTTAAATGSAPIPPAISTLTEGVLSMMGFAKAKMATLLAVMAGLVGFAGFGGYAAWGQGDEPGQRIAPGQTGASGVPVAIEAQGKKDPETKPSVVEEEVKKLQGAWKVVSAEVGGMKAAPPRNKRMSWTFTGNSIVGKSYEGTSEKIGTFTLRPEKSPRQIDILSEEGKMQLGIYRLEGERLTICLKHHLADDERRPTEFTTTKDANDGTVVFEYEKDSDKKPPTAEEEVKTLQGKWMVASVDMEGRRATPADIKGMSWTFTGKLIEGQSREKQSAQKLGTFTLDPQKPPRQIDIVHVEGPQKGKTMLGIYKLEGERLTICLLREDRMEQGRPAEFSAKSGSNQTVIVLVSPKEAERKRSAVEEETRRFQGKWKVVKQESEGASSQVKGLSWTFTRQMIEMQNPNATPPQGAMAFALDPEKSPRQIDIIGAEEPERGMSMFGIYKFEGGRLIICLGAGEEGSGRPTQFSREKGSKNCTMVLERWNEADQKQSAMEEEIKKLQGKWKLVRINAEGARIAPEKDVKWTFRGKLIETHDAKGAKCLQTLSLDPEKSPKQIDFVAADGKEKGKSSPGIYKLEGDHLTICMQCEDATNQDRPTDFLAENGSKHVVMVFERADAANKNPSTAETKESMAEEEVKKFQGKWKVVKLEWNGVPGPVTGVSCTFTGNVMEGEIPNQPAQAGAFTVDPEKTPRHIDLIYINGPQKGGILYGIYKLEGKQLTICLRAQSATKKGRPTEFSANKESDQTVIVLERAETGGQP